MALDNLLKIAGSPMGTAALGIGQAAVQQLQANKLQKKADSAFPELVDPNQASFLSELEQKRNAMETGAQFASGMATAESTGAGTMQAITEAGGGDAAQTIQGLLQAQKGVNAAKNQVLAQGEQMQGQADNLYSGMLNKIAARKMQLQLLKSQQYMAERAKKAGAAGQNFTTGVAGLLSSLPKDGAEDAVTEDVFVKDVAIPGRENLRNTMFDSLKSERIAGLPEQVVPQDNLTTQGLGSVMKLAGM